MIYTACTIGTPVRTHRLCIALSSLEAPPAALSCHTAAIIRAQYRLSLPSYFLPRFRVFSSNKKPHHNLLRKTTRPPTGRCPVILNMKSSVVLASCACFARLLDFRLGGVYLSFYPLKTRQSHLIRSRQSLIVSGGLCRPHRYAAVRLRAHAIYIPNERIFQFLHGGGRYGGPPSNRRDRVASATFQQLPGRVVRPLARKPISHLDCRPRFPVLAAAFRMARNPVATPCASPGH